MPPQLTTAGVVTSNYRFRLASLVRFDLAILWSFEVVLSPSSRALLFAPTIFVASLPVSYAVAVTGVTMWIFGVLGAVGDPVASTMGLRLLATAMAAALVPAGVFVPPRLTRLSTREVAGA